METLHYLSKFSSLRVRKPGTLPRKQISVSVRGKEFFFFNHRDTRPRSWHEKSETSKGSPTSDNAFVSMATVHSACFPAHPKTPPLLQRWSGFPGTPPRQAAPWQEGSCLEHRQAGEMEVEGEEEVGSTGVLKVQGSVAGSQESHDFTAEKEDI